MAGARAACVIGQWETEIATIRSQRDSGNPVWADFEAEGRAKVSRVYCPAQSISAITVLNMRAVAESLADITAKQPKEYAAIMSPHWMDNWSLFIGHIPEKWIMRTRTCEEVDQEGLFHLVTARMYSTD